MLGLTQYQNGVTIQTQGNRCVFQESIEGTLREVYEVHPLVQRYAEATRLVAYNAVGINWLLDVSVRIPETWIQEKIIGAGGNFSDFFPTSVQIAKELDFAVCNLVFRVENARIVIDCNYHFELGSRSPDVMASTLNAWRDCQEHLIAAVLPQL